MPMAAVLLTVALVSGGQSKASVVLPADALPHEKTAANLCCDDQSQWCECGNCLKQLKCAGPCDDKDKAHLKVKCFAKVAIDEKNYWCISTRHG